jgi:hypothetical protein
VIRNGLGLRLAAFAGPERDDDDVEGMTREDVIIGMGVVGGVGGLLNSAFSYV